MENNLINDRTNRLADLMMATHGRYYRQLTKLSFAPSLGAEVVIRKSIAVCTLQMLRLRRLYKAAGSRGMVNPDVWDDRMFELINPALKRLPVHG